MARDRQQGADRCTVRGAARIGLWFFSWPFASITVSRQTVVLRAMWSTETAWRDDGDRLAIREG
ncbi:MAG: hypothetical protein KDB36_00215, partial [Acidimicrobiales bacterium]|nr:hypothetical protein [Acidimicrobiales bacterium]